jgi:hypothetical protein
MAKSARTVRDAMVGEKPSEDSHEQAFIEYEERMAAIRASAQAVSDDSDLQLRMDIYLSMDQPPSLHRIFNTHFLMLEIRRQLKTQI